MTIKKKHVVIPELQIRLIGDKILSQKAKEIQTVDESIQELSQNLIDAMLKYDGLGLAATQVGIPLRIIALAIPKPDKNKGEEISPGEAFLFPMMPITIINPKIISFSNETNTMEEGCLSVPGIFAEVKRPSKILIEGIINLREKITIDCGGLLARALQHEIDHLDGILFIQRLDKKQLSKIKKKLEILKKEAEKTNYIRLKKNE
ncbi:MAG TPA: peptide deformylase [Victivallales bacterium]|nr:peptide deformylase [Victivallales bacterium]HPO89767.1 peptide deformylase [Victivallales bacterium]HRR28216.1 peptide deformylase [Victivallales bacterium]HRU02173.1 peptide deformylase [Victivallales bacterium]